MFPNSAWPYLRLFDDDQRIIGMDEATQIAISGGDVIYLLRDEFTTAQSAGAVNGTPADGTGQTRTVVDSANKLAVTANGLELSAITGTADPALHYPPFALAIGFAFCSRIKIVSGTDNIIVGLDSDASGLPQDGFRFTTNILSAFIRGSGIVMLSAVFATNTTYDVMVIHRNPGTWHIIRGGAFTDWTLGMVNATGADASLYPYIGAASSGGGTGATNTQARKAYAALLGQWSGQYANATQRKPVSVNNDTITAATGDAKIEHTITAATGVTQELRVRWTDDNNCIIVRMDQTNSTVRVYEKNAGVETELTGGTTAMTWTNGTQYRVYVELYGNIIHVIVAGTLKNNTTSTGFNASVTGVKVSHAGNDLIAWPTIITGGTKAELDSFFPL